MTTDDPPVGVAGRGLTRRQVLAGSLASVGALAMTPSLTACSSAAEALGAPIQVWDLFSGADGQKMQAMIAAVLSKNPGMTVKPVTLAWGAPYYTKLAMASAGRRPPDTAVMHVSRLAGYAPGGLLEPWDLDLLASMGVHPSDFAEGLWKRCLYRDELYALPLDTHPVLAFYNKDLADKAGVLDGSGTMAPPTSPEAMLDLSARLGRASGDTGVAFGYLMDTAQAWRLFWGLYAQTGGAFDFTPGRKASMDVDAAARVLDFVKALLNGPGGKNSFDYPGAITAFNNGRAGMILEGEWELNAFQKSVKNLGAMPMPTLFGRAASYADSHAYVLPRSMETRSPERKEQIYRLVAGLLKEAGLWARAGHIPAYTPVRATADYRALKPQSEYASAIDSVVLDPPVWFAGAGTDFQNQMSQALTGTFRGQQASRDTVARMLAAVDSLSSKPNPA